MNTKAIPRECLLFIACSGSAGSLGRMYIYVRAAHLWKASKGRAHAPAMTNTAKGLSPLLCVLCFAVYTIRSLCNFFLLHTHLFVGFGACVRAFTERKTLRFHGESVFIHDRVGSGSPLLSRLLGKFVAHVVPCLCAFSPPPRAVFYSIYLLRGVTCM